MNNSHSRFFHHFMSKQIPCILLPPAVTSTTSVEPTSPSSFPCPSNDHILNLSASMTKHCPLSPLPSPTRISQKTSDSSGKPSDRSFKSLPDCSIPPEEVVTSNNSVDEEADRGKNLKDIDFNSNDVGARKITSENQEKQVRDESGDDILRDGKQETSETESRLGNTNDNDGASEIDVDERSDTSEKEVDQESISGSEHSRDEMEEETLKREEKKSKSLAFGIDRILSFKSEEANDQDQKSPTASPSVAAPFSSPGSPRVVSSLSGKSDNSADGEKQDKEEISKHHHHPILHPYHNHSILSKLKLCTAIGHSSNETPKRSPTLPFFHHPSYGFYRHPSQHNHHHHQHHHHHQNHMNSIINPSSSSSSSGGMHSSSQSHCSECIYLRRFCGGSSGGIINSSTANNNNSNSTNRSNNIPSSSSSSANNVTTNNMQFSSALTTPCGSNSSSLSASFTWMANPSIYDSSAVISPVAGFNQHMPLQPSFGMSSTGYSTLASIHQQCNSGGGSGGRRKRSWSRAVFSNLQRKGLEKRFQLQKYITKPDRRQLAATLGLTDAQVKVWFQNRRMKWRHSKEGKVSSGTGETVATSSSSPPVSSTTSSKQDGAIKDKKA